jgi:hypothetical protein
VSIKPQPVAAVAEETSGDRFMREAINCSKSRLNQIADDPVPLLTGILSCAAAGTPILGELMLAWTIVDACRHYQDHIEAFKSLRDLICDDTPAGLAQATVLLGEILLFHKATKNLSTAGAAAVERSKQAFNKFASFVEEEQSLALAAQAAGTELKTPYANMVKNARDMAVLANEEGTQAATQAIKSVIENKDKIVLSKESVSSIAQEATGAHRPFSFEQNRLQHAFSRHGKNFNITSKWNKKTASEFEELLKNHVQRTDPIRGTHRGVQQVIHYFDPVIHLNVITELDGNLVGAWKLSADQIKYLLST